MSRHRAPHRSFLRTTPLGAGVTVALLAAGAGSAFAGPTEVVAPVTSSTCESATTTVGLKQTAVDAATKNRDAKQSALQTARAELRKVQGPYNAALNDRNDARDRLDSLENRRARKEVDRNNAQQRVDALKNKPGSGQALRTAQRDLARAVEAVRTADAEIVKARVRLAAKETALGKVTAPTAAQRAAVTDAKAALATAEGDLEKAKAERRTARADRTQACSTVPATGPTSGVTTLG